MKRLVFVALVGGVCAAYSLAGDPPSRRDLSPAEQQLVNQLAEKAVKDRGLWKGKIYLTNTDVVLDSSNALQRYAILTYYRYDGDLGIVVSVNADQKKVTKVEEHPHMPTSLTPEEIAEAEKMARGHAEVKKALAKYKHLDKIEADIMVLRLIDAKAPGFQHRVARLFFRDTERNYLQLVPTVDVDLTTGEVRLDAVPGLHDKK